MFNRPALPVRSQRRYSRFGLAVYLVLGGGLCSTIGCYGRLFLVGHDGSIGLFLNRGLFGDRFIAADGREGNKKSPDEQCAEKAFHVKLLWLIRETINLTGTGTLHLCLIQNIVGVAQVTKQM